MTRQESDIALPKAEWDEIVRRGRSDYRLPGIVAAVVVDGDLVWERAEGEADPEARRPATPETVFRAGSITKLVTALAVMILRDRGELSLDDPVVRYLPEFPRSSITLRHLMSHTSGLQREFSSPSSEVPGDGRLVTPDALSAADFFYPPGIAWKYSNFGYAVLGEVVRRVADASFREFVIAEILRPLGMSQTSFEPRDVAHEALARGHQRVPREATFRPDPMMFDPVSDAAGQLFTTARDLSRLASLFVGTEPSGPLARTSVLEMKQPVVMVDESWRAAHGLGPMLVRDDELVMAGHGGEVGGFASWVLALPQAGVGAAALTNIQDAAPLLSMLIAAMRAHWDARPRASEPGLPPSPDIAELLGEYFGDGCLVRITWRDRQLRCEWLREDDLSVPGPVPLVIEAPDLLRFGRGGLYDGETVSIARDGEGRVSGFWVCSYEYRRL